MVDAADPVLACHCVQHFDQLHPRHSLAVDRNRNSPLEPDSYLDGFIGGIGNRLRPRVGILGWLDPRIFEVLTLDRLTPQVAVDRVDALVAANFAKLKAGLCRVQFFLVAGHTPLASWSDDAERVAVGRERHDSRVEAHLVVALACAAVGDRGCAYLAGCLDQFLRHQRATERGRQRVDTFVHCAGLKTWEDIFVDEFVFDIPDQRLHRARLCGPFFHSNEFGTCAKIYGECDDIHVVPLPDPDCRDCRVHAPAISEDALFPCHF